MSPALACYLAASQLAAPLARLLLARRAARGKEDKARLGERMGRPGLPRPDGPLVWLHGASVGEALAALALIARMGAARPGLQFLLTTGTLTSARMVAPLMPPTARHQFAPLDAWAFVTRFLAHWRPDLAARIDSELWPATLVATAQAATWRAAHGRARRDARGSGIGEAQAAGGAGVSGAGGADVSGAGGEDVVVAGGADVSGAGGADVVVAGGADVSGAGGADVSGAARADVMVTGGADVVGAGGADVVVAGGADVVVAGGDGAARRAARDPAGAWRGAPLALVNGRISARSQRGWAWAPGMARALMARFSLILAQDAASAARFMALGADPARVRVGGALKAAAPPPAADPEALASVRAAAGARPVWVAASTHAPEEALALAAHAQSAIPGLLTIIAPRHPERGAAVAALARGAGLTVTRRSAGQGIDGAAVHVADTLGEMGLWYRLAPFAFIGGSVAEIGGHNPYEPAALGAALAHGPHVANFADAYAALDGAARRVTDAGELAAALVWALAPGGGLTPQAAAAARAGAAALAPDTDALDAAAASLLALLDGRG